jgi:heme oxygenase
MTEALTDRFSVALRTATRDAHRGAERGTYLDALLAGRLTTAGYAAMVAQHHHIYAALEDAAATMRTDPVAAPFADIRLTRLPAIEADLACLLGDDWRALIAPTPTTRRYVDRLHEVCHTWPGGFVAHHYTRYLGDLSGGQYIATALSGIYELPATAFYDFTALGDLTAYRDRYRALLDAAPWCHAERERITAEVLRAYELNTGVFAELGQELPRWVR